MRNITVRRQLNHSGDAKQRPDRLKNESREATLFKACILHKESVIDLSRLNGKLLAAIIELRLRKAATKYLCRSPNVSLSEQRLTKNMEELEKDAN